MAVGRSRDWGVDEVIGGLGVSGTDSGSKTIRRQRTIDLLNGLVSLTVDRSALGVYVTHLADDLSPLPDAARIDGIFAEGLTPELNNPFRVSKNRSRGEPAVGHAVSSGTFINNWHSLAIGLW